MKDLKNQTYDEFCRKDRERILAANPTIDQLIADYSYYRFCWAVNHACRVAGGKRKASAYLPQLDYLIDALYELQRAKKRPNLPNLKKWVERDSPYQLFSDYLMREAVKKFKLLITSKHTDKES